ncbi:MAG TPA: hypothetical protein VFI73_12055 [Candidatus Nitrosopolaris sp.]|nr:hypothetical protein [Candidatus Nitrosopolaris sp.]
MTCIFCHREHNPIPENKKLTGWVCWKCLNRMDGVSDKTISEMIKEVSAK